VNRRALTITIAFLAMILSSCSSPQKHQDFRWTVDRFADIKVMRYQVPGFEGLSLRQKKLVYYLSQAALSGRDILFAQNGRYNLAIRKTLDAVAASWKGDRSSAEWAAFMVYTKQVWFANGIYHHYGNEKFTPAFPEAWFRDAVKGSDAALLPLAQGMGVDALLTSICPVMFDPTVLPKKVSQDPASDMVANSAVTFYNGVSEKEAEAFYKGMKDPRDPAPPSHGLNTTLVNEGGRLVEKQWKVDGLYGSAIREIVGWLRRASSVAENDHQRQTIDTLVTYYTSGDLRDFDAYNILWLRDTSSTVDFVNGFIETYNDPLGIKASWEANVNFKDLVATRRAETITANAQWFEDHSPVDPRFKKKEVKGVSAKVITVAQLGGDCYPATPIGINLPNADWIRAAHGSKSVTLENITYAYDQAALGDGFNEEFCSSAEEVQLLEKYGSTVDNLHTDLHECIGHASGQMLPGVSVEALKNYHAVIEEARADLFALYYLMDPRLVELGLIPSQDAAKAAYIEQMLNGLFTQLKRIEPGKSIEQAHMRNRQMIARWCFEKGKAENVIALMQREGKTYFRINDFGKLRALFGELLKEVQRIKSEGDYAAAKALVEGYGVKVDPVLHAELLARYKRLNLAPYGGFMNPVFSLVEQNGEVTDVLVAYPEDFTAQMLEYGKKYGFLTAWE
jgi:dipeptidyl-peptidase III